MNYNPFALTGKTVFVTGASSGIGRSTAIECSRLGAKLIINGRDEQRLRETLLALDGDGHRMIVGDLSVELDRQNLLDSIPNVDGVVYCAGISGHMLLQFIKENDVKKMFDINYFAPLYLSKILVKKKKINKKRAKRNAPPSFICRQISIRSRRNHCRSHNHRSRFRNRHSHFRNRRSHSRI